MLYKQEESLHFRLGSFVFDLVVAGKYNFIVGNTCTGKSMLRSCLRTSERGVPSSYSGFLPLVRFSKVALNLFLGKEIPQCILYADEDDFRDYDRDAVVKLMRERTYCWLIACRDVPSDIPFGVYDIYTLNKSGKHYQMRRMYSPELFRVKCVEPGTIVCEDSNAGAKMVKDYYYPKGFTVVKASSKDNVTAFAGKEAGRVYLNVDMCGYGACISKAVHKMLHGNVKWNILDNPSFEYQMLTARTLQPYGLQFLAHSVTDLLNCVSEEEYYTQCVRALSMTLYGRGYSKEYTTICKDLVQKSDYRWLLPQLQGQEDS